MLQPDQIISETIKNDFAEDVIDSVAHPEHYCAGRKYEPKDVIRDWELNFNLGNVVKYISRAGRKDGNSVFMDLEKARQYLDYEIKYLMNQNKCQPVQNVLQEKIRKQEKGSVLI